VSVTLFNIQCSQKLYGDVQILGAFDPLWLNLDLLRILKTFEFVKLFSLLTNASTRNSDIFVYEKESLSPDVPRNLAIWPTCAFLHIFWHLEFFLLIRLFLFRL
jgi:hypothetical protein